MLKYLLKRFLMMLITLFMIITATFFLMRAIPGGPFSFDRVLPPSVKEALEAKYNLDKPVIEQYFDYLHGIIRFDFGPSYVYFGQTVNEMMADGWPASSKLGAAATVLIVIIGLPIGIVAALNRNKPTDRIAMGISTVGVVVPSFVMATFLLYFFSIKVKLLPTFGVESYKGYILPAISLAIAPVSGIVRLLRSSMLDTLSQDYMRTAESKGLSRTRIIVVHGLRNSLIPVTTSLGMIFAALLTGTFVIETIFAVPGLGRYFVSSISNRDYTAVMALTILSAAIMVAAVFIIDIIYLIIDPRIRLYEK
ncbi:MAG: ABC transporter permease [Anaerolineaceae bacterium]|nr:ABC transporter permease [Anaerolineaceae bacterium]